MIIYHDEPSIDQNQSIPFKDIIKFGEKRMIDRPLFSTSWVIGRFCNYDCSYCWPGAKTNKPDYQDFKVYINAINEIKTQARENGFTEFHWAFSGGEPTAYKNLLELIHHLDDGITPFQSIHMTTNLSPGKKWWSKWCENTLSLQQRNITASYHAEFADEIEFGDKCLQLTEAGVGVTINQVMVPSLFWELYERCDRFYQKGINVTLRPQRHLSAPLVVDGYTDEMINIMQIGFPRKYDGGEFYQVILFDKDNNEYLLDQSERFNSYEFSKFKDWECVAGFQSVVIIGDQVRRGYSCHDKLMGNLANFKLFKLPKACMTKTSCVCSADSKLPKWKYDI